jgi:hypothetical protein
MRTRRGPGDRRHVRVRLRRRISNEHAPTAGALSSTDTPTWVAPRGAAAYRGYRAHWTLAGRETPQWLDSGRNPHIPCSDRGEDARGRGRAGGRKDACGPRAGAGRAWAARRPHVGLPDKRRRCLGAVAIRARSQRRLARMDGGSAARPARRAQQRRLSGADADHVRELRAGAPGRANAARAYAGRGDRARRRDPAARPAADLPGRVRLPRVRAPRRAARPGSLHALCSRSSDRPGLPVHRLAISELPLRPAVHAAQLRDRTLGTRGRAVGVQGDSRSLEPRCGRADRPHG